MVLGLCEELPDAGRASAAGREAVDGRLASDERDAEDERDADDERDEDDEERLTCCLDCDDDVPLEFLVWA